MKYAIGVLGGFLAGIFSQVLVTLITNVTSPLFFLSGWAILAYLFAKGWNPRNVFGRISLTIGLEFVALPLAVLIFSIRQGRGVPPTGPEVFGALFAGGILTIAGTAIGFFGAIVFLVTAYFLLRKSTTPNFPTSEPQQSFQIKN